MYDYGGYTVNIRCCCDCDSTFFIMIDKSYFSEYISSDSSPSEELCVKEELLEITKEDEAMVIKYLLDIMRKYEIITEEEYRTVLYKYS